MKIYFNVKLYKYNNQNIQVMYLYPTCIMKIK